MINGLYRFDFGVYSVIPCILVVALANQDVKKAGREFFGLVWRIVACASPWLIFLTFKGSLFKAISEIYLSLSGTGGGLVLPNPTWDVTLAPFSQHNAFTVLFYAYPIIAVLVFVILFMRRRASATHIIVIHCG